jgi:hypothetical protein
LKNSSQYFYILWVIIQATRDAQERFQHSGETITRYFQRCYRAWAKTVDSSVLICCRYYYRYFNAVLRAMLHLYGKEVRLSLNEAPIPPQIYNNTKFYLYFKDCLGAIDGTHIQAHISSEDMSRFRDRLGDLSQNVLPVCDFDLFFNVSLSGLGRLSA